MKLLCFSDLHCDTGAAEQLVRQAAEADVLVGAGDFANQHRGIHLTLDILSRVTKPAVLVPGNGETHEELEQATAAWAGATVLHASGCTVLGQAFWGVGGGIPVTPFGAWSYDFDEAEAGAMLRDCPVGAVLVVHSPPQGVCDRDGSNTSRGSSAIRAAVLEKQPSLVVCGHIHNAWGQEASLGSSRVLNAGPVGILVEI